MRKKLVLRTEHLTEITPLGEHDLAGVVGASGITCTDLPPTVNLATCHSFPNC